MRRAVVCLAVGALLPAGPAFAAPTPHRPAAASATTTTAAASSTTSTVDGAAAVARWLGDSGQTLRYGTPTQAGLLPQYVAQIGPAAASGLAAQPSTGHPMYPGAVVLAARGGVIVSHQAMGWALRYA